ncbi:MAG: HTH-type transcriptional regulator GltR [Candidatus Erwinia impunctatus]
MDSDLLKTFLQVSRTRHFGRAAEALYLTQSAVSFRIRQLENQLGTALFIRHRNNIQLTPAGERLIPYAEKLMNTWLQVRQEIAGAQQQRVFSVGASPLIWEGFLSPWLHRLLQHPKCPTIGTKITPRQLSVHQLHERHLDLLITTTPPKMDELCSQAIGEITMTLFSLHSPQKDEKFHYIKLDWDEDNLFDTLPYIDSIHHPVLITPSVKLARQSMQSLSACTYLPIEWQYEDQKLKAVADAPVMNHTLFAVWWKKNLQHALIQQLIDETHY